MSESIYVLAASYDDVQDALGAYQAVEAAYRHIDAAHDIDVTVLGRDASGNVEIVRRHDSTTKERTTEGLGWGLAAGAVAALFPAVGILGALAVGGGAGAALGALAGHASRALSRDELKSLGDVLDRGDAGLVVVYGPAMSARVNSAIAGASAKVHVTTDVSVEALAAELQAAVGT